MSNRHKHAGMMLRYARDAAERPDPWTLWQTKIPGEGWVDLTDNPAWYEHAEYRRLDGVKVRPAFYRDQTRYLLLDHGITLASGKSEAIIEHLAKLLRESGGVPCELEEDES